jgi:deazaflavin-dependent oxidoreductase (nitroreductase family)
VIAEFRANHGRVGGVFEGSPLILLSTTGAKSGQPRTNPLRYLVDGDRLLVAASYLGSPSHPAWYHNLCADPRVSVEIGGGGDMTTCEATAVVMTRDERDAV